MGKHETKYCTDWEKSFDWLQKVPEDIHLAKCKFCDSKIQIRNGGASQLRAHASTKKHKNRADILNNRTSQSTILANAGQIQLSKSRLSLMSTDDEVLRSEILWALKCAKSNFSFASNNGNNNLFATMFPDSAIAKSYKMAETKCKYMLQFGVYPWLLEDLKEDIKGKPISFLFDETTTIQVKKQYDAYVRYESKRHGKIVDRYCGSLFLGHCDADQLVTNFCSFGKKMDWEIDYLLQIMMDGPRTNLSFYKKLVNKLNKENKKSIIDIGTCSLHKVHNAFEKALKK